MFDKVYSSLCSYLSEYKRCIILSSYQDICLEISKILALVSTVSSGACYGAFYWLGILDCIKLLSARASCNIPIKFYSNKKGVI